VFSAETIGCRKAMKLRVKLSGDSHFQRAFTACVWVLKGITLVLANQGNYSENANACS